MGFTLRLGYTSLPKTLDPRKTSPPRTSEYALLDIFFKFWLWAPMVPHCMCYSHLLMRFVMGKFPISRIRGFSNFSGNIGENSQGRIVFDVLSDRSTNSLFHDFTNLLSREFTISRFLQGTSEKTRKEKLLLMSWCPDTARIKKKMLYSSSFDALKKCLVGVQKYIQVCKLFSQWGQNNYEVALIKRYSKVVIAQ